MRKSRKLPFKPTMEKGEKHNKLTAIRFSHRDKKSNQIWLFKCDCGNETIVRASEVKNGGTKACGCLPNPYKPIHKKTGSKVYVSWQSMKQRCLNKNSPSYKNWGGRGITICNRWMKFENFYEDMGERPEGTSIDRINNNKGYFKENCRWATNEEQCNNKRTNHLITYKGKTQPLGIWATELGMKQYIILNRIRSGWDVERALTK